MQEWIDSLIAFAHDDRSYDFGTRSIDEMRVVTADDVIEIQKDERFGAFVELSSIFAGTQKHAIRHWGPSCRQRP